MTDRVHKWHLFELSVDGAFCVKGCSGRLSREEVESRLNEYETLKNHGAFREALIIALHLLGHADFKNGNTGPSGLIDEGEVHASRLMDKIQLLVPQLYADILEGK